MAKPDYSRVLWFGPAPVPPRIPWYHLGFKFRQWKFKPHGIRLFEIAAYSDASDEFRALAASFVAGVREDIKPLLIDYGVAVAPVRDIYEVADWSCIVSGPRGHGDRFTWAAVSGLCKNDGHLLVITELAQRDGYMRRLTDDRQFVFNHELGHVVDHALGLIAESPEFIAAWERDVARIREKLPLSYQMRLAYYIAEAPQGPSETFAEGLASHIGGGCMQLDAEGFGDIFPECSAIIARLLQNMPQKAIPKAVKAPEDESSGTRS